MNICLPMKSLVFMLMLLANIPPCNAADAEWTSTIIQALKDRDSYIVPLRAITKNMSMINQIAFLPYLEQLGAKFNHTHTAIFTTAKNEDDPLVRNVFHLETKPIVEDLYPESSFAKEYANTGLGFMLEAFRSYYDNDCAMQILMPPQPSVGVRLPLDKMCAGVKANHDFRNAPSIDHVCKDFVTCVDENACAADRSCDVARAFPRFGAVLWYKISNYIAHVVCGAYTDRGRRQEYRNIALESRRILTYMATLEWAKFFNESVQRAAFSNLDAAMALVGERRAIMRFTPVACKELRAAKMCVVADILKQYTMLSKMRDGLMASGVTRDLRLNPEIDHQKMLELNNQAILHLKVLREIRSLDENLQAVAAGISRYFGTLAALDQRIGEADVAYISGELKKFNSSAVAIQQKLIDDTATLMKVVQSTLALNLASQVVRLAATIAENVNPFKMILTGVDTDALYERTTAVVDATSKVAKGATLIEAIKDLSQDTIELTNQFKENNAQLESVQAMVNGLIAGKTELVEEQADTFATEYANYTPREGRHRLVANDVKWSAYINAACDLLNGADASDIEIGAGQLAGGVMLLCENLEGTLAEFFTLREDIYDFQFDLVDALARVVRGNIARKLAASIRTKNEILEASELMRGFFMQQYQLQSEAFLFCNILQYKRHGKRNVTVCPRSGFFDYRNVNSLIAQRKIPYHKETRYVFLPTRPSYPGDTGYVNLPSLIAGNPVYFQLPQNRTWLQENKWITCNGVIAPFVTSFKIFLPKKVYGIDDYHTLTRVTLTNTEGSFVAYERGVRYILPKSNGNYATRYEESYQSCPYTKEIPNPYALCNNLPNICDTSTQSVVPVLRPTILSTWKLQYSVQSGAYLMKWNAPNPATELYLKAKVELEMIPDPTIKCPVINYPRVLRRRTHCCLQGNQYRIRWLNQCTDCPTNSTSNLGGYYCEKDV